MINEALLVETAEWRERAACLHFPAVLFFGQDDAEPPSEKRLREEKARTICMGCCVREECLEYALATREQYGIWGGLTEVERRTRMPARSR